MPEQPKVSNAPHAEDVEAVRTHVDSLRREHTARARDTLARLDNAVNAFLAHPDDDSRAALQDAWRNAHDAWVQIHDLVLDDAVLAGTFRIDAWPIEPGFLDSLPGYPDSGIVMDTTLDISAATLAEQNGITDKEEVSLGFHPLEYYAFLRPVTDFIPANEDDPAHAEQVMRRRQLVQVLSSDLRERIDAFLDDVEASRPPEGDYLTRLLLRAQQSAQGAFRQASLIVDADHGHCEFSQSSRMSLAAETKVLQDVFEPDGKLMDLLRARDEQAADNLESALGEAGTLVSSTDMTEAQRARLPLLFSSIGHQLESFATHLSR